jgi:hypothetical protein
MAILCAILLGVEAAAAEDPIAEYYKNHPLPAVKLVDVDPEGHPIRDYQIPAVLAVLKYELDTGTWPNLARSDRDYLISYLDDPNLTIRFTGERTQQMAGTGGQAIDRNTIKITEDGLSSVEGSRGSYAHARTILHELCHIYQKRSIAYGWIFKERWPEAVEAQLPRGNFDEVTISRVTKGLSGATSADAPPPNDELPDVQSLLQELREGSERSTELAKEAKSLRESGAGSVPSDTTMMQAAISSLENSVQVLLGQQQSFDQAHPVSSTVAADVKSEAQAVIAAKHGAEGEALKACEAALGLKNADSADRRDALFIQVRTHATKAGTHAKEAKEAFDRACRILQDLNAVKASAEIIRNLHRSLQLQVERQKLELEKTRQAVSDAIAGRDRLREIAGQIQKIGTDSSSAYQEALRLLSGGGRSEAALQKVTEWKTELETLWNLIRYNVDAAKPTAASEAPEAFRQIEADLGAYEQRLKSLESQLAQFKPPAFDLGAVADAQSAVDAAEAFVEPAQEAARNAELCLKASADRVGQPAPGTTTAGNADWDRAVGGADVGGSSQGAGGAGSAADALIRTAESMANAPACDYGSAIRFMEQARSLNPGDPRIAKELPAMRALAQKQAFAEQMLDDAYRHIQSDNNSAALDSLRRIDGGPCERDRAKDLIAEIENMQTRTDMASERDRAAERDRNRRETAGKILDTLIGIRRAATGGASAPATSRPGGTGTTGAPPEGQSPSPCCNVTRAPAQNVRQWALFLHDAGCKNYMVIGLGEDMTPQEYARVSGMRLIGTGNPTQLESKARSLCSQGR